MTDWFLWLIVIGVVCFAIREVGVREHEKITALCVQMRQEWRGQQGEVAEHFQDFLPLTDELVSQWFAKRGQKFPKEWATLLALYDAEQFSK